MEANSTEVMADPGGVPFKFGDVWIREATPREAETGEVPENKSNVNGIEDQESSRFWTLRSPKGAMTP